MIAKREPLCLRKKLKGESPQKLIWIRSEHINNKREGKKTIKPSRTILLKLSVIKKKKTLLLLKYLTICRPIQLYCTRLACDSHTRFQKQAKWSVLSSVVSSLITCLNLQQCQTATYIFLSFALKFSISLSLTGDLCIATSMVHTRKRTELAEPCNTHTSTVRQSVKFKETESNYLFWVWV